MKAKPVKNDDETSSSDDCADDSDRGEDDGCLKSYETVPLNCFRDLYRVAPIYKFVDEFGSYIAPLSLIGHFFNYAGNHILHYAHTVLKRKMFYPSHKVTSV